MQFLELETKRSRVLAMPECSMIQGSKISGILFTIYVNEVPELHRVMEDTELLNSI